MNLLRVPTRLEWGELDLPLLGLTQDWHKTSMHPPAAYSLAMDAEHFWFVATHSRPARVHPLARPGKFLAELWKHDVAELFLANPENQHYLELNLAPNGSWWSARFHSPREMTGEPRPLEGVQTYADLDPDGNWVAALSIPLTTLVREIDFSPSTTANVTFILNSPDQYFLSAASLPGKNPDFHQPDHFQTFRVHEGSLPGMPGSN
ncbi:MAG: hypothetical protein ACQKBU_03080 [Verrucomicrobiales bacterium]